jgi:hypothetical protein
VSSLGPRLFNSKTNDSFRQSSTRNRTRLQGPLPNQVATLTPQQYRLSKPLSTCPGRLQPCRLSRLRLLDNRPKARHWWISRAVCTPMRHSRCLVQRGTRIRRAPTNCDAIWLSGRLQLLLRRHLSKVLVVERVKSLSPQRSRKNRKRR